MRVTIAAFVVCVGVPVFTGCGSTSVTSPTPVPSSPAPTPTGPRTEFGPGEYRVSVDIAPGRYFSSTAHGCEWARESGFSGSPSDVIASGYVAFEASQVVVDIASSDQGFKTDDDCTTWSQAPKSAPPVGFITPGWWVVGSQVAPGTYRANTTGGCHWQRLSHFGGTPDGVIAEKSRGLDSPGPMEVVIEPSDVGFRADTDCGPWEKVP